MQKTTLLLILALIVGFTTPAYVFADGNQLTLEAGSSYLNGSFHHQRYLSTGYMKLGFTGTYADYDNKQYSLGAFSFAVGNDALAPGLTCEIGLKGIGGKVERYNTSSDVGNVAFTFYGGYMLPRKVMPVALEIRGNMEWAPEILSFLDSDGYFGYGLGLAFFLVDNAAVVISYHNYDFDLDKPRKWELSDDVFALGIELHF